MDIFGILNLLGGLALFLYGMSAMGDGLVQLSGGRLEKILEKLTQKKIMAVLLGLLTLRLGQRMHAARLKELRTEMRHYHKLSERALRESGKEAYKAVNRQGHEAFGYYFSLNGALWVASLWPVPLALAWMQARFGTVSPSLPFSLPLLGPEPGFVFWFVLAYIPLRLLLGRLVCPVGQDGQGAIID